MKKLTYLVIATAALSMVACTGGNKAGYTITGTVEGASDGDTVYLQEANGRNLTKLDTAVITKGTFTFEGTQDSVVSRYVTCEVNGEPLMIDFFLENGKINVALTKDNDAVTGTPNNDAYQEIRAQINDISKKMNAIYEAMGDTSLSDEQKEAKQKEVELIAELKTLTHENGYNNTVISGKEGVSYVRPCPSLRAQGGPAGRDRPGELHWLRLVRHVLPHEVHRPAAGWLLPGPSG